MATRPRHIPEGQVPGSTRDLINAARLLRSADNATQAERVLWDELRNRKLHELKFRRQQMIGPLVDFFCASCRLIVEVDGTIHDEAGAAEQDVARTSILDEYGFRIDRVKNEDVLSDLAGTLKLIAEACDISNDIPAPSRPNSPLPRTGERGWG